MASRPERSRTRGREREGGTRARHHTHTSWGKTPERRDAGAAVSGSSEAGERRDERAKEDRERAREGDKYTPNSSIGSDIARQRDFMRSLRRKSDQRKRLLMKKVSSVWNPPLHWV